ncbi:MAG: T9SS type A sorting domain-containing protein [Flavobacteriales bacterium]|nr:T9SS type A sorting domain-containing protein [Flavobacteriales bacterium]
MDYWHILDVDHPYCAYGALAYVLTIINAAAGWANPVWYMAEGNTGCCPFVSRSPDNQIPHSSIYWDGAVNAGTWNNQGGQIQLDNDYAYVLILFGCGGSELVFTGLVRPFSDANIPLQSDSILDGAMEFSNIPIDSTEMPSAGIGPGPAIGDVRVMPNPAREQVVVQAPFQIASVAVLDELGREHAYLAAGNRNTMTIGLMDLAAGMYVLQVRSMEGDTFHHRFIKE